MKGTIHPYVERYGPLDPDDSASMWAFVMRIFEHGLTVGMWASHAGNVDVIKNKFRAGTLPRTMQDLSFLEYWESRERRKM